MKKLLLVALLLGVAGGLFAQDAAADAPPPPAAEAAAVEVAGFTFDVHGKLDAIFLPFQLIKTEDETLIDAGLGRDGTTNGPGPRFRLFFSGKNDDDSLGFRADLQFLTTVVGGKDTATLQFDDNVFGYARVLDKLILLEAGKYKDETLIGKVGDPTFDLFTVEAPSKDDIFTAFISSNRGKDSGAVGFLTMLQKDMDANQLIVGFSLPSLGSFGKLDGVYAGNGYPGTTTTTTDNGNKYDAAHVYERAQVAFGYKIGGLGLVRLQYVGANANSDTNLSSIPTSVKLEVPQAELAFALQQDESPLLLDIGVKYPLPLKGNQIDRDWVYDDPDGDGTNEHRWTNGTYDKSIKIQAPMTAALGLIFDQNSGQAGGIYVPLQVRAKFLGKIDGGDTWQDKELELPLTLNAHLAPTYTLAPLEKVGLDVGFEYIGKTKITDVDLGDAGKGGSRFGVGAWYEKGWQLASKGFTSGKSTTTLKAGAFAKIGTEVNGVKEATVVSVPIVFDFQF